VALNLELNQIQAQTWSSACGKTPDPRLDLVWMGQSWAQLWRYGDCYDRSAPWGSGKLRTTPTAMTWSQGCPFRAWGHERGTLVIVKRTQARCTIRSRHI